MSKLVKELITEELKSRYHDTSNALWFEMVGVDGITTNAFRRDVRSHQMRLEVVRTSLFRQACEGGPMSVLAEKLNGPSVLLTGGESAIDCARLLKEWDTKFPKETVRLRGALLEGEFIDEQGVQDLHKMPSKQDLQGQLVAIIVSPASRLASCMTAPAGNIAGCLKTIIEKLEKGEPLKQSA
jgi:large subunit ribosomal protein L10